MSRSSPKPAQWVDGELTRVAHALRACGFTFMGIAMSLGISKTWARRLVKLHGKRVAGASDRKMARRLVVKRERVDIDGVIASMSRAGGVIWARYDEIGPV